MYAPLGSEGTAVWSARHDVETIAHAPFVQSDPAAQAFPQRPQCIALDGNTVSHPFSAMPSQSPNPSTHARPHVPIAHVGEPLGWGEHEFRQRPQLRASTRVSVSQPFATMPSQSPNPIAHVRPHTPPTQPGVEFGPPGHTVPHVPQFIGSVPTGRHVEPQRAWPVGQGGTASVMTSRVGGLSNIATSTASPAPRVSASGSTASEQAQSRPHNSNTHGAARWTERIECSGSRMIEDSDTPKRCTCPARLSTCAPTGRVPIPVLQRERGANCAASRRRHRWMDSVAPWRSLIRRRPSCSVA